MPKTPTSSFSLQNSNFRFKFFFDQNLDFVLGYGLDSYYESENRAERAWFVDVEDATEGSRDWGHHDRHHEFGLLPAR